MTLVALTEQLPDPDNRITPDFERPDVIGVPKPRVFFRLNDYTATALAAARKIHEQLFHAVGATGIGHVPHAEGAGHIMGTTRMGTDSKKSVARRLVAFSNLRYSEPYLDHCGPRAADSRGDQGCHETVTRMRRQPLVLEGSPTTKEDISTASALSPLFRQDDERYSIVMPRLRTTRRRGWPGSRWAGPWRGWR